mgnify:CR=1 FL=1
MQRTDSGPMPGGKGETVGQVFRRFAGGADGTLDAGVHLKPALAALGFDVESQPLPRALEGRHFELADFRAFVRSLKATASRASEPARL